MDSNYFIKLSLTMPQCFTLMPIKTLITLYKALRMSDQDLRIFGWHHNNPECYFGPQKMFYVSIFFTVSHWSKLCWCCSPRWPPSRTGWSGSCTWGRTDTCSCARCPRHTCSTRSTCPGRGSDHWARGTRSCCLKWQEGRCKHITLSSYSGDLYASMWRVINDLKVEPTI